MLCELAFVSFPFPKVIRGHGTVLMVVAVKPGAGHCADSRAASELEVASCGRRSVLYEDRSIRANKSAAALSRNCSRNSLAVVLFVYSIYCDVNAQLTCRRPVCAQFHGIMYNYHETFIETGLMEYRVVN